MFTNNYYGNYMRCLISFAVFFLINIGSLESAPIRVTTQQQFDAIVDRVNNGEALSIQLAPHRFVLKKHIVVTAPLSIIGRGASITCSTIQYTLCVLEGLRLYIGLLHISLVLCCDFKGIL